jgi:hypothetical protein
LSFQFEQNTIYVLKQIDILNNVYNRGLDIEEMFRRVPSWISDLVPEHCDQEKKKKNQIFPTRKDAHKKSPYLVPKLSKII